MYKKIKKNITAITRKSVQRYNHKVLLNSIDRGRVIGRHRLSVQIQTVSNCNGKCIFCPYQGSWHQKNPGKMDWTIYEKIVKNLENYKILKFCPYLQNEPLLDKGLFTKIRYALKRLDIERLELSTNLAFLNDDIVDEIVAIFPNIRHEIWISFHGINKTSYEDIMGLDYERSLNNVLRLVEQSQKIPLNIVIRGAGSPKTDLGGLKSWFGGEEYLSFWGEQLHHFKDKPKVRFITYHDRAGSKQLKIKNMSFNRTFNENLRGFYCNRFDRWLHFLYTGEPILCCMDYSRETAFHETINEKSIEELYSSKQFHELLKKGTGQIESGRDFICKRCVSPGG